MLRAGCIGVIVLLLSNQGLADEIFFKNGDRLSGQIVRMEGGRLTFKSKFAGEVTVNRSDLESFKSDEPLDVRLEGGGTMKAAVSEAAKQGDVTIAPGTPQARTVPVEQVKAINPKDGWSGSLLAGLLVTRGNSDTDNANFEANVEKRRLDDRLTAGATYLFGRQRDPATGEKRTTTDNWNARAKYDYFYSPKLYGYANVKVEKDNIANLDLRLTPGIGLGYQFVDRDDLKASAEAGLTYVYEKFSPPDTTTAATAEFREHNEYLSGRLAYKIEKKFNDRLTLFQDTEYLPSFKDIDDYLINANAGMRVGLTGSLFLEYKFTLSYDSVPAPGASNDDLRHVLSVGWQF